MRLSASTRALRRQTCKKCECNKIQPTKGRAEWCNKMPENVQLAIYCEDSESTCPLGIWPDLNWRDDVEFLKEEINLNPNSIDNVLISINKLNANVETKNNMRDYLIAHHNKFKSGIASKNNSNPNESTD